MVDEASEVGYCGDDLVKVKFSNGNCEPPVDSAITSVEVVHSKYVGIYWAYQLPLALSLLCE